MDLAANQILMQAFLLVANLLDGFATAAEVFGGRAIGARSRAVLVQIVRRSAALSLGWTCCSPPCSSSSSPGMCVP
jgi:MATE family multidrug resistance protein